MDDNWLVKNVVFGIMDGQNRRGRPSRERMDDIKEGCGVNVQTDRNGDELSLRHWTPTSASRWNVEELDDDNIIT